MADEISQIAAYTEDGETAYYSVLPAPSFQAQLDRIEAMLKALTDLPHNKRYDQQPLAEQPK